MRIFVDESGDPGFKLDQGSSRFFVVALVIFDDLKQMDLARAALDKLKIDMSKNELKFSKMSKNERIKVLKTAGEFDYKIRAVIFDKVKMNELQLEHFKENYYQYAIRSLLERKDCYIHDAIIKIDTFGELYYRDQLTKYFVDNICTQPEEVFELLIFEDSKYDTLIQLADNIAGALRKSYLMNSDDAQIYRQVFTKHEEDVRVFDSVLRTKRS